MSGKVYRFDLITTILMDMDGVLTDGRVITLETGEHLRYLSSKDAYAIQHAVKAGYRLALLSGGHSVGIEKRMHSLGVTDVFMRVPNKLQVYEEYKLTHNLTDEQVLYIGDDMPDYEVMQAAGIGCAPADAAADILEVADYITQAHGGQGAVREVIEKLMKVQDIWFNPDTFVW